MKYCHRPENADPKFPVPTETMARDSKITVAFNLFMHKGRIENDRFTQERQIAGDTRRVRFEVLRSYAERLEVERLRRCPSLYSILSSTIKAIDYPAAVPVELDIAGMQAAINEWDSSWGFLLSVESGGQAQDLRGALHGL